MSPARRIAAQVLRRVWQDEAYAAAALSAELDRHAGLDGRDRALATELVYGVLRTERYLLERLARHGKIRQSDVELTIHLLVAVYQLAFLDRVPGRAAVHEAVGAIRKLRGARVAGFANAVLRKLAGEESPPLGEAVRRSAPSWLVDALVVTVGSSEADALLGAAPPIASDAEEAGAEPTSDAVTSTSATLTGLGLRAVAGRPLPSWMQDPAVARPSPWAPRAFRYLGGGDPRRLPGYAEGAFLLQEEGAQLVTWAVGARRGERVLDACAGRGQKASLLAELVGPEGELWATDLHAAKLDQLRDEFARLRLPPPRTEPRDWTAEERPLSDAALFDRALVDVPCAGDGTLRRRPEILRRLSPDDPKRLTRVQAAILRSAAAQVRPGGRVVYATCSVLPEACEAVLSQVSDVLEPCGFDAPEVAEVFSPQETALRLLPGRHGTDGYFVASLRRR